MEKLYTVSKTRQGDDCGSDNELLIAKFRLKLKKVGKTTRPFRYDLKQIPYDYTMEVRNIFKGLDLLERGPDKLWTEVCDIVQETGIKTIPMEKKYKKAKWFSWQNSISLSPASFCTPRPNLPVTPDISCLPTFAFQSPVMKRTSFWGVSSKRSWRSS